MGSDRQPPLHFGRFENLTHLTDHAFSYTQPVLDSLASPSNLQTLSLTWTDPLLEFPELGRFKETLKTLRILCSHDEAIPTARPMISGPLTHDVAGSVSLSHLTTLSIHLAKQDCLKRVIAKYVFPVLRVLSLQDTLEPPRAVYEFIHMHPTIEEVDVSFLHVSSAPLLPLTMVTEGSDAWKTILVDSLDTSEDLLADAPNVGSVAPLWSDITVSAFAFSRVALTGDEDEERGNVRGGKYRVTALAIKTSTSEYTGRDWKTSKDFTKILTLGSDIPAFRNIETFSLNSVEDLERHASFSSFMVCIFFLNYVYPFMYVSFQQDLSNALKTYPALKRFSFLLPNTHTTFPTWGSVSDPPRFFRVEDPDMLPLLVSTMAPIDASNRPITFNQGTTAFIQTAPDHPDLTRLQAAVVKYSGAGAEAIPRAELYMIPAWRNVVEPVVREAVLWMARQCAGMEVFEWWLSESSRTTGVVWRWVVKRDEMGFLMDVEGKLHWREPQKFKVLVGQELELRACDRF